MKRLITVLALAVLVSLLTAGSGSGLDDTRAHRELKRLTNRFPTSPDASWPTSGDAGRVLGPDGRGLHVYVQVRTCGKGKWHTLERETTTARGRFDFNNTHRAQVRRKYHFREYRVRFPSSVQFGFYIPGTDEYVPFRLDSNHCYGGS